MVWRVTAVTRFFMRQLSNIAKYSSPVSGAGSGLLCAGGVGQARGLKTHVTMTASRLILSATGWLVLLGGAAASAAEPVPASPEAIAFFEKKIRPVLAESCYKCHSAEAQGQGKLKGGLFLDTREGVLAGGDTGPAVVPGKPAESLLVKAVRWSDPDTQMPPKHKLADEVIADLTKWVEMGLPDPRSGPKGKAKREINVAQERGFRSFAPLAAGAPPEVKNAAWTRSPVDRFVLAKQEAAGVTPSAPLSREKLARRAFFGLTGLPPSPEEMAEFLKDQSAEAFPKLLDRLLASPRYGERWGRHWLDLVRYAESNGYEFDAYRNGAYHYRDWVIRALNDDLPYRDFVRWQLAGDKLAPGSYEGAAATGFLVAGPYPGQITVKTEERIRYDQLDDMLATIGNAMLGLTMECVRCHDHKYDPIPQADYYSLAAVFGKTVHGKQQHTPVKEVPKAELDAYRASVAALEAAVRKFEAEELPGRLEKWREAAAAKPAADARWQTLDVVEASATQATVETRPDGVVAFVARPKADPAANDQNEITYTVVAHTFQKNIQGLRLDALADKKLPKSGPGVGPDGSFHLAEISVTAAPLAAGNKAAPLALKLTAGQARFAEKEMPIAQAVDRNPETGWRAKDKPGVENSAAFAIEGGLAGFEGGTVLTFQLNFRADSIGRLRLAMTTAPWPAPVEDAGGAPAPAVAEVFGGGVDFQNPRELLALLDGKLVEANRTVAARLLSRLDEPTKKVFSALAEQAGKEPKPKQAEVYTAVAGGREVFLLRRGEVDSKERKAAPGFIQVLATKEPERWLAPAERDPRVALGDWMTDAEGGAGHLLARVIVNRIWKQHFGQGIVASVNDFGVQGRAPTHPELLDYLAGELIRGGWKLKPLHRLIMLTAAYQQGADVNAQNQQRDPDNQLVWQVPARRLEAEAIRDALLSVGEKLDPQMYGPPVNVVESPRRSVYLRVRRSELVPFLTLFDAPDATRSIGDRGATTVPTQALTMLNSPFVRDMAGRLAQRALAKGATPEAAIAQLFQIAFSRPPTAAERAKYEGYFLAQKAALGGADPERAAAAAAQALAATCHVALASNEFIYVD